MEQAWRCLVLKMKLSVIDKLNLCVQAHAISESVHDINLTDLTAETIGKVYEM